jgi:hypothetical protein
MVGQDGREIVWNVPDARQWLVRRLGEQDAAQVRRAFGMFVKEGVAPQWATVSTTID